MLEHRQDIVVDAPLARVWGHVGDMANWAAHMPGYQSFEVVSDRESLWILKVGVAALVRTVRVLVHIDRWDGPEAVDFTYRLEGDPVDGVGTYRARTGQEDATEIELWVTINGQGPMSPVWEAMARPILPRLAKGFAEALKTKIEQSADEPA